MQAVLVEEQDGPIQWDRRGPTGWYTTARVSGLGLRSWIWIRQQQPNRLDDLIIVRPTKDQVIYELVTDPSDLN